MRSRSVTQEVEEDQDTKHWIRYLQREIDICFWKQTAGVLWHFENRARQEGLMWLVLPMSDLNILHDYMAQLCLKT